jgi:hypothetical protein
MESLTINTKINVTNSWIMKIPVLDLLKYCDIKGFPLLYAKALDKLGKIDLGQIYDITNTIGHPLKNKADHVVSILNRRFTYLNVISKVDNTTFPTFNIQYLWDGLKSIKITHDLKSKEIRDVLDGINHQINIVIAPKIDPNIDKTTLLVSLANSIKLTSIKHKNIMLRLLNGDIFCNERLKRFKFKESDLCEKCNEIETSKHLIYECPTIHQTWINLSKILSKYNINFEPSIYNILNVGDHCTDIATMTIVAEILNITIQKHRPPTLGEDSITMIINRLVKFEQFSARNQNSWKKFNKFWTKFIKNSD